MIIKRQDQIDDTKKDIVLNEINTIPIDQLIKKTGLTKQEIISILTSNHVDISEDINIAKTIKDNKIIIISDTHIGSIYENINNLDLVYDYAINHNITKILHGGDLLQSSMKFVNNDYIDPDKQFKHFVEAYPKSKQITTYLTLGNHDLHIIDKFTKGLNIFKERKDIKALGFKRTYIKWQDSIISVLHDTPKYQLEIPNLQTLVNLHGHRHNLKVQEPSSIHIPTLSDNVMAYHKDEIVYPGFLVAYLDNDVLNVEHYIIKRKIINKGIVFTKHI